MKWFNCTAYFISTFPFYIQQNILFFLPLRYVDTTYENTFNVSALTLSTLLSCRTSKCTACTLRFLFIFNQKYMFTTSKSKRNMASCCSLFACGCQVGWCSCVVLQYGGTCLYKFMFMLWIFLFVLCVLLTTQSMDRGGPLCWLAGA